MDIVTCLNNYDIGKNVSFTITGIAQGYTVLRLFAGSSEIVEIPVIVS